MPIVDGIGNSCGLKHMYSIWQLSHFPCIILNVYKISINVVDGLCRHKGYIYCMHCCGGVHLEMCGS